MQPQSEHFLKSSCAWDHHHTHTHPQSLKWVQRVAAGPLASTTSPAAGRSMSPSWTNWLPNQSANQLQTPTGPFIIKSRSFTRRIRSYRSAVWTRRCKKMTCVFQKLCPRCKRALRFLPSSHFGLLNLDTADQKLNLTGEHRRQFWLERFTKPDVKANIFHWPRCGFCKPPQQHGWEKTEGLKS